MGVLSLSSVTCEKPIWRIDWSVLYLTADNKPIVS